jgi:retron-type reverse transcriptase
VWDTKEHFQKTATASALGRLPISRLNKRRGMLQKGKPLWIDLDLEKFFDEVNHHRLMWLLSTRIGRIFESWLYNINIRMNRSHHWEEYKR